MSDFYNKYPYMDFHELNLDWVINKVKEIENGYNTIHDELTNFEQFMNAGYLIPEMFGAKGDGVTDDSEAIEKALNSGSPILLLNRIYYIAHPITVDINNCVLYGVSSAGFNSRIRASNNVTTMIKFNGYGNSVNNITFETENINQQIENNITACMFEAVDIDSKVTNCTFYFTNIGIVAKGKNLNIENCNFSLNKIGIKCELYPYVEFRGIIIKNNRFHSIGANFADPSVRYPANSWCILFPDVYQSDQRQIYNEISNNFCDYGRGLFSGCILGTYIHDNIMYDCYRSFIHTTNSGSGSQSFYSQIYRIINNVFIGHFYYVNDDKYVDIGIDINDNSYGEVSNNIICNVYGIGISLNLASYISIKNNIFNQTPCDGDSISIIPGTQVLIKAANNCNHIKVENNINYNSKSGTDITTIPAGSIDSMAGNTFANSPGLHNTIEIVANELYVDTYEKISNDYVIMSIRGTATSLPGGTYTKSGLNYNTRSFTAAVMAGSVNVGRAVYNNGTLTVETSTASTYLGGELIIPKK